MRVKCIKKTTNVSLTFDKIYEVISIENGWYRIIDDTEEDYLYPTEFFITLKE